MQFAVRILLWGGEMTVLLTFDTFSSPKKELGLELSTSQDRGLDP